jgi:branched-chain amino acid transport system substrate-binding protein
VRIPLSLLAAAALAVLPQTAPAAPAGQPIVIGAILSITGLYAPLGEPESKALRLAEKDINAHGGIAGRPLHIIIQDDEGKGDTAAQLATGLIGQNVAAIIGGSLTPTSLAIARVTSAAKVVQLYPTPTSAVWNAKGGVAKYIFEVTPRNEIEATKLLSFTKGKLGAKKIALLHDDAPYGTQGAAIATDEAHRQGLEVADDEPFPITSTDVTAQLGRIKASGADTIVIWTASPTAALAVRQIRQLGLNTGVVGSTGIVSDNFLRIAGKDGDGVYADMDLNVTHPNAPQRAFMNAYHAAYDARPNNFASFVWDAAHLAALALNATHGNSDGDALSAALVSMKPYAGSTGTFKFSESDHNGMTPEDVHIAIDRNAIWFTL